MKSARFTENSGLWLGCDNSYYTPSGTCRICGKKAGEHNTAGHLHSKSERAVKHALERKKPTSSKVSEGAKKYRVVITRGYRTTPLDYDNLVGGCKPLRDEIAAVLGRDDAERFGITWEYRQERGATPKVEIFEA